MLIIILFYDSSYRCFIETLNDELKSIAQAEHSTHRCFDNFFINLLGLITACLQRSRASMYKELLTHSLYCSEFIELTLV